MTLDYDPEQRPWTAYASFHGTVGELRLEPGERAAAAADALAALDVAGVTLRGSYSVAGFRADADLMLWLVGESADALQKALVAFRHSRLGRSLVPHWSAIGVHREAEFAKSHKPAFLMGEPPRRYVCVYPFVRSLEWYLLDPQERRELLVEHGVMGREYPDVRANTVSTFALSDYEWLLAFEADDLGRIVDIMRHLRGARARLHTRHEIPFLTGLRKELADVAADLP